MLGIREMCMSSSENEEEPETLGPFFDAHYSQLLKFLPDNDIATMSILNQKWNQRVESHKIWMSLLQAMQKKNPAKKELKKVVESVSKPVAKPVKEHKKIEEKAKPTQPVVSNEKFSK